MKRPWKCFFGNHDYFQLPRTPEEDADIKNLKLKNSYDDYELYNLLCSYCGRNIPELTKIIETRKANIEFNRQTEARRNKALQAYQQRTKNTPVVGSLSLIPAPMTTKAEPGALSLTTEDGAVSICDPKE